MLWAERAKRNSRFGGSQEVMTLEDHIGESQVCGAGEDNEGQRQNGDESARVGLMICELLNYD